MAPIYTWLLACVALFSLKAFAADVKIMPLGDSTTAITCWRAQLFQMLQKEGLTNFHFVGTQKSSNCNGIKFDGAHEGYPAIKATKGESGPSGMGGTPWDQDKLPPILAKVKPDVSLILLGVNDMAFSGKPAKITAAFSKLVDQMRASKPTMKIIVAKIPPMKLAKVDALNAEIDVWAPKKSTAESPITVVDCFKGYDASADNRDGVHMNDKGDKKVAACFFPAVVEVIKAGVV